MNVEIVYTLSEAGQKASILSGGDGKREQSLRVDRDDPDFGRALDAALVDGEGRASLDLSGGCYWLEPQRRSWDRVPTAAEVLDDMRARKQAKVAKVREERDEVTRETLGVLEGRKTREMTHYHRDAKVVHLVPAWPYPYDSEVVASPEAAAWEAELEARNAAAEAEAEAAHRAAEESREAAEEAANAATAAYRAERGLRDGDLELRVEAEALVDCPCWESHRRGKNWMAAIAVNAAAPGGLDRVFFPKAKGEYYYLVGVGQLAVGEAVEFGADYYTGSGKPSRTRWYGYVVRIEPDRVVLRECASGKQAIKAGEAHVAELAVPEA